MSIPLRRCWDLTEAHIIEAIGSRHATGVLLREMAAIARPDTGAPKILIAIARIAKPECDWLDGALHVEIDAADASKTRIGVMEDLGGGVRELVFPRLVLETPVAEFERSLRLAPRAIEPLVLLSPEKGDAAGKSKGKLVLRQQSSAASLEPPSFEVAEECLRKSLPPGVRTHLAEPTVPRVAAPRPPTIGAQPRLRARPVVLAKKDAPPATTSDPQKKLVRPPPRG